MYIIIQNSKNINNDKKKILKNIFILISKNIILEQLKILLKKYFQKRLIFSEIMRILD